MPALPFRYNAIAPGGAAASGAKLTVYAKSTTTPAVWYTDSGLTTPATNPLIADSDGRWSAYTDSAVNYTVRGTTSDGATTIFEADITAGVITVDYEISSLYHQDWTPMLTKALAFTDIASATTTDIGAAASSNLRVTGTTTITGLGTSDAGVRRTLRFAAALTLTHNATSLILPGAANITTAANDTADFVSLGSGNWLCTNYERASGVPVVYDANLAAFGVAHTLPEADGTSGQFLRTNGAGTITWVTIPGGGDMLGANNLSEITNATTARSNLGVVIGTNVQAYDADLGALAANSTNGIWVRTGSGTGSARTVTAGTGITVTNGDGVSGNPTIAVDATALVTIANTQTITGVKTFQSAPGSDSDAVISAQTGQFAFLSYGRAGLGARFRNFLDPSDNFWLSYYNSSGVYVGDVYSITSAGVLDFKTPPTILSNTIYRAGGTDVALADGGTGASLTDPNADRLMGWDDSAGSTIWFSLGTGLAFNGTAVELDADLQTLAGLSPTANNFIVGNAPGLAWESKTPAQARTSMGAQTSTHTTLAALKADVNLVSGQIYWIRGVAADNDGGFGAFLYDSGSSATTYTGLVEAHGSLSGRLIRQFSGPINLCWSNGATTNITTALQVQLNYVKAAGSGHIIIPDPPGARWELTAALEFDATAALTIEGMGTPIIFQTGADNGFELGINATPSNYSVILRNLRIWSDGTGLVGVRAWDLTNLKIEGCDFYKWGTGDVYTTDCYTALLLDTLLVDDSASPQSDYGWKMDDASANNSKMIGGGVVGFLGASAKGIVSVGEAFGFYVRDASLEDCTVSIECEESGGLGLNGLSLDGVYFERLDAGGARAIRVQSGVTASNISWRNCQFLNAWVDIQGDVEGVTEDSNDYYWNGVVIDLGSSVTKWRLGNSRYPNGGTVDIPDNREWQYQPAWQTYAVTWTGNTTNPVLGNGTLVGRYKRDGNTVTIHVRLVMGSTTTYGTGFWKFSLPFSARSSVTAKYINGICYYIDTGTLASYTALTPIITSSAPTFASVTQSGGSYIDATGPHTWANTDELEFWLTYECA